MRHFANIVVIVIFLVWILPLGIFIKPEKEEKACNGQRAICMCSKMKARMAKMAKMAEAGFLQAGTNVNKEKNSSSMSPDYLVSLKKFQSTSQSSFNEDVSEIIYQFILPDVIDHVPKV